MGSCRKSPQSFRVQDRVHGLHSVRVDVLDGVGERDGILQASDTLGIREIDLR
jgi:hypothetical protein